MGAVLQEHLLDDLAAGGGALELIQRWGGFEVEFFGEFPHVFDVFFAAHQVEVSLDAVEAHVQVLGDFQRGPAEAKAGEDFAADGGGVAEAAGAGVFALGLEGRGFLDFVAEEEAGGDVADELIPEAGVDGGEVFYLVAGAAGEKRWGELREVGVRKFFLEDGIFEGIGEGTALAGVEDGADGDWIVQGAD